MAHNLELLHDLPKSQVDRLTFIDFRLFFLGELRRSDIVERFSTGGAGATRDIALYKDIAPENCDLDNAKKVYRATRSFSPVFDHPVSQALIALSQGFGDISSPPTVPLLLCSYPWLLSVPRLEVLTAVSRAIHQGVALRITYSSNSSGASEREIVPFALASNGVRWHVRAFDRKRKVFTDFVLTRIGMAEVLENNFPQAIEKRENDIQWSRIIELELKVHPNVKRPEVIAMDYDMVDGIMKVKVRASDAGYFLRLWNVDCSSTYRAKGLEFVLCLHDPLVLYAAESAMHAPYYVDDTPK